MGLGFRGASGLAVLGLRVQGVWVFSKVGVHAGLWFQAMGCSAGLVVSSSLLIKP